LICVSLLFVSAHNCNKVSPGERESNSIGSNQRLIRRLSINYSYVHTLVRLKQANFGHFPLDVIIRPDATWPKAGA